VVESWLESSVATCCSCVEVRVTSMSSSCSVSDRGNSEEESVDSSS
jgi:hypothetical protein